MTFYITTPIYYPNAQPHIGHAYTTVLADVLARWRRFLGEDVYFLTGTDEHGLKLQRTAEERGLHPQDFVDKMVRVFKAYWAKLLISYTRFIRTTEPAHEETVRKALMEMYESGYIYKGVYKGWYCVSCETFYGPGEYIEEGGVKLCPWHRKPLELVEEEAYFLKLSEFQDYVVKLLESDIVVPKQYAREVLSRIERYGLRDVAITRPRSRVWWGVPAPWDESHTVYVWVDALLNYLTALGYGESNWLQIRRYWPSAHHIVGKDILWFHSAIWWPILRMLGLEPPRRVIVHGLILVRGQKMSKSLGNIVTIDELLSTFGSADAVRYLLMRFMSLEKDVDYDPTLYVNAYNAELADTYGNLVRRVAVLARKKLGGVVEGGPEDVDGELAGRVEAALARAREAMEKFKVNEALVAIFDVLREANAYLNRTEPWRLEEPRRELYNALEAVRVATLALQAWMPVTAEKLSRLLGFPLSTIEDARMGVHSRFEVREAPILFRKLRAEQQ